jgi:hypothetical protein
MASPAINKANAQNSTGPRSVEGKAVSRFNALKHGLDAASLVIPGEDPAELARLAEDFHNEYQPKGALETELVEILVRSTWLRHRYIRVEAQVYQSIFKKLDDPETTIGDAFHYDASGANVLGKLFRRQSAATRDFNKALAEIRRLQDARMEMEMLALAPPPVYASVPTPELLPVEPWVRSESQSRRL